MLPVWFIYIAAGLRLFGGVAYLRATLAGKAKPNPLSWLLWGVTPLVAFFAGLSTGFHPASVVTLALGISPFMVFVAAMFKNPRLFRLDRFNLLCAFLAASGIALWRITNDPQLAIALSIVADIAASFPTIYKTIKRPYTEYAPTYAMSAVSMIITMLAVQNLNFITIAFPLYVLVINIYMVILIACVRWYRRRLAERKRLVRTIKRQHRKTTRQIKRQRRKVARDLKKYQRKATRDFKKHSHKTARKFHKKLKLK